MKRLLVAFALIAPWLVLFWTWRGEAVQERRLFFPEDTAPFSVDRETWVGFEFHGPGTIDGWTTEATVQGPAKIAAQYTCFRVHKGEPDLDPPQTSTVFIVRPTDYGIVNVTITATSPQPGAASKVRAYQFEVN